MGRIDSKNRHMIGGHSAPIADMGFSPFFPNILGTCSQDKDVRIWNIKDEDIASFADRTESEAILSGHQNKISFLKWHPTCDYAMASISQMNNIRIWDVNESKLAYTFNGNGKDPTSLNWNYDGSLMATITSILGYPNLGGCKHLRVDLG